MESVMKLIETKILGTTIRMRYADNADPLKATQWLDFQVPLADLSLPAVDTEYPLGDPEKRYLGSIRQAALRYVRNVIAAETQRLASLPGQRA
jgi:hypothetical protein